MNPTKYIIALGIVLVSGMLTAFALNSDYRVDDWPWLERDGQGFSVRESDIYVGECGDCHHPYQPGLLPAVAWERIMADLSNHFGESAVLDRETNAVVLNFLLNNAAGRVNSGLPNKFMAAQRDHPIPMRITEMRYFQAQHDELSRAMVQDNPQVRSFSNCDSCHQNALQGLFEEHDVRIPGYEGRTL